MCRRPAPPLRVRGRSEPPRRMSQRSIELIGLAIGVGYITAVAFGRELSNDAFWSLAAGAVDARPPRHHGPGPVQLHGVASSLGDRRVGLRGRSGRALPGGRYSRLQRVPRRPGCGQLAGDGVLHARSGGAGWTGGRHRPALRAGHRGCDGERQGAGLLARLAAAGAAGADQGAGRSALAARAPAAVRGMGQHARVDPDRAARAGRRVGVVLGTGRAGGTDRRRAAVAVPRRARSRRSWAACSPRASRPTARGCWPTTSGWRATRRSPGTSTSGTRPTSTR